MQISKTLLPLLCYLAPLVAQCQTPVIDTLKQVLATGNRDPLPTLFALCDQGESMSTDSFMRYAREAEQISMDRKDETSRLRAEFFIARCYGLRGLADSSLDHATHGMRETEGKAGMADLYNHFLWQELVALSKKRKIDESQRESFRLLEIGERSNDVWAQVIALNNIGVNYNLLRNRPEAKKWMIKAWKVIGDTSRYKEFPIVFTNLAVMYALDEQFDSAQYFLDRDLLIARQVHNLRTESDALSIEAQVYANQNKMDSAEQMLKRAASIQQQSGNAQIILGGLEALASFTATRGQYDKAISYLRECQDYSRRSHEPLTLSVFSDLAECYRLKGNYKAYGETLDTLMRLKDSLYQKSKAEDLAKMEVQYELSAKEAQIAKQKLELLHKDLWIGGAALAAVLILTAAVVLFRRWRRRQAIALAEAEEKERRRIAADLHDNLGAYASAITAGLDEIDGGSRGTGGSPAIRHLKELAVEITSSLRDTIWVLNKESITLTGISDRIKVYARKMQGTYPSVSIAIDENISQDLKLSPMHALHIFRIIQEAMHNALEHSHGHGIMVAFESHAGMASVSIADDGDGFDPGARRSTGNGLANMKSRAEEAGFGLAFERVSPQGTRVVLSTRQNTQL